MNKGETDITLLLKSMKPVLNEGEYVFCTVEESEVVDRSDPVAFFKEKEGTTIVIEKSAADKMNLTYSFVSSWITLSVHSSLEAIGLTAAFSNALSDAGISCNVIAAYYHDHIFVPVNDKQRAMEVLTRLSQQ
ncbi:MAG: ACT domain-containing protein [Chitinophagaceae bacterium]